MKRSHNSILVEDPHITSMAALVILNTRFMKQELEKWFSFRREFLEKREPLMCTYCGKTGLISDMEECRKGHRLGSLATIDHVIPISKGGARYDELNCTVACYRCNQKKKDSLLFGA